MKKIFFLVVVIVLVLGGWAMLSRRSSLDSNVPPTTPPPGGELSQDESYSFETTDGRSRTYAVHLPDGYVDSGDYPVLIHLHGGGAKFENFSGDRMHFSALADEEGYIVVYPAGTGGALGLLTWNAGNCCGYAENNDVDDVAFIRSVVSRVTDDYSVDESKIFVSGMSNGAMMANRLACEATDIFAGAAAVSGPEQISSCDPSRPIPMVMIHGTEDKNVPYQGGKGEQSVTQVNYMGVEESLEAWAQRNGCSLSLSTAPIAPLVSDGITIDKISYPGCDAATVLYRINGGTHSWPGGGTGEGPESATPTRAFDASATILGFFGIAS